MQAAPLIDLQDYNYTLDGIISGGAGLLAIYFMRKKRYLWAGVAFLLFSSDLSSFAPAAGLFSKATIAIEGVIGIALANGVWWELLKDVTLKKRNVAALKDKLWILGGSALTLFMMYAHVFEFFGLKDTGTQTITHNLGNGLYFTIATWTTVGYGDLVPYDGWTKLFASLGALNGYVLTGILISALLPIFLPQVAAQGEPDATGTGNTPEKPIAKQKRTVRECCHGKCRNHNDGRRAGGAGHATADRRTQCLRLGLGYGQYAGLRPGHGAPETLRRKQPRRLSDGLARRPRRSPAAETSTASSKAANGRLSCSIAPTALTATKRPKSEAAPRREIAPD